MIPATVHPDCICSGSHNLQRKHKAADHKLIPVYRTADNKYVSD
jgi:hypothetical protein